MSKNWKKKNPSSKNTEIFFLERQKMCQEIRVSKTGRKKIDCQNISWKKLERQKSVEKLECQKNWDKKIPTFKTLIFFFLE